MRYFVLIDGEAGDYGVAFPDLPGCVAMGDTVEGALANAADALRDWIDLTEENGDSVPPPRPLEALRTDGEVARALSDGASLAAVPLVRETGKSIKANLSLDAGLLAAIDEEAQRRKLTRSAFIELMARRMLSEVA
ncbi:MAG TPA: type II toxin-antitoxin system HicB family antitoxin [Roseiarcus sp.]|nr:type II toxin-antitoxin system HicB family antitoxin [Roseiarcus sp.]